MNMQWHNFIFSNQPAKRRQRHLVCWLLWWIYIVFTIFVPLEVAGSVSNKNVGGFSQRQPGLNELGYLQYSLLVSIKTFLLLLTHLSFCYAIVYVLVPDFLLKRKYWRLVFGILLICVLMAPVVYFLYSVVYPFIDNIFNLRSRLPKPRCSAGPSARPATP